MALNYSGGRRTSINYRSGSSNRRLFVWLCCCYCCWLCAPRTVGCNSTVASAPARHNLLLVARGLTTYLQPSSLNVTGSASTTAAGRQTTAAGSLCKIFVDTADRSCLRVGRLQPLVFDCNFPSNVVRYTHSGNPSLAADCIRLTVRRSTLGQITTDSLRLGVTILPPADRIFTSLAERRPLIVDTSRSPFSDFITADFVQFHYNFFNGSVCMLTFGNSNSGSAPSQVLVSGTLVASDGTNVGNLSVDCRDFLKLGYRYRYTSGRPLVNYDYIPLTVEVEDFSVGGLQPVRESIFLPVKILNGAPNSRPKITLHNYRVLQVDQFRSLLISPEILSASDIETVASDLLFTVLKPQVTDDEGFFALRDDPSKPIMSFFQSDLFAGKVAFHPPTQVPVSGRQVEISLIVTDGHFTSSSPVRLPVAVRYFEPTSPKVIHNSGFFVWKGQSACIGTNNLEIAGSGNLDQVKFEVLRGGPVNGNLKVSDRAVNAFNWTDVRQCNIVYEHDGINLDTEELFFRVSSFRHSIRTRFTISIIPGPSEGPSLEVNNPTEVRENGYAQITTLRLHVDRMDYEPDAVRYDVISPPQFGDVLTMYRPMTSGRLVSSFTQRDVDRGHIWYHHRGAVASPMHDAFQFTLGVGHVAATNEITVHRHEVIVRPYRSDSPPRIMRNASLSLTMKETDYAVKIMRDWVAYEDRENPNEDVVFVVTCQPFIVGVTMTTDAGCVAYNDEDALRSRRTTIPPLRTFTQSMIDAGMVAYIPPHSDIGPKPLHVQFLFSVSDLRGNFIVDQRFNITVLPVDNQIPTMSIRPLKVVAGSSAPLSSAVVSVADVDTDYSKLVFTLEQDPTHGSLVKGSVRLAAGDQFTVDEFSGSLISYVNDDVTAENDGFGLSISDGTNKLSKYVSVQISPASAVSQSPLNFSSTLTITEGGRTVLPAESLGLRNLSSLNRRTSFEVMRSPSNIAVMVRGVESRSFLLDDVLNGFVSFVHTGDETGSLLKEDSLTLTVTLDSDAVPLLIDLLFDVRPVDNSPPELVIGNYLVISDDSEPTSITPDIISAIDQDTLPDDLTFFVAETPVWGRLEKQRANAAYRRGRSSSQSAGSKRAVTSFTMSELRDGTVRYVRSNSSTRSRPSHDSFGVLVSDGKRNSSVGQVEVAFNRSSVLNHLIFNIDNIEVQEGGEKVVNVRRRMDVDRRSRARSELMLSLASPALHGRILLVITTRENGGVHESDLSSVALSDLMLPQVRLIYRHDGSETSSDHFSLSLSDGSNVKIEKCHVLVMPVNDERPSLRTNEVLPVPVGGSAIISSSYLKADDGDSSDDEIRYVVVASPRKGSLYRQIPGQPEPVAIKDGDNFTQLDIDANRISFVQSKNVGDIAKDNFIFQLTDGVNVVSHETFDIEIILSSRPAGALWNRGLTIPEGNTAILTVDMLSVMDASNGQRDNIVYRITRPPMLGYLGLSNETSRTVIMPVVQFLQADLTAGRIFYAQTIRTNENTDEFEFQLLDGQGQTMSEDRFEIRIEKPAVTLPTLNVNVPLTVIHGYKAPLTSANLHSTASRNVPTTDITYSVVESPRHGQIWKSGLPAGNFSQSDIDQGLIEYKSDSSDESMMDYFLFTVSVSRRSGSPVNSTAEQKPLFFSILIQPITKIPPTVVRILPPTNLIPLGSDRFGFLFSSENLKSTHPMFESRDVVYQMKSRPQHGYLEHLGSRRPIKRKFSQKDIDEQRIAFVLNEQTKATNDSFVFRVLDPNRNAIDGLRLQLEWSVIQFGQPQYIVCEDTDRLAITVQRSGAVNQTCAVRIRVKPMTAKENLDFIEITNGSVEFLPGVTEINWMIEIVNDGVKEGNDEKFKILLENATNAILGTEDKTQVHLIDYEDGHCMEYIGMITKNSAPNGGPLIGTDSDSRAPAGSQPPPTRTHPRRKNQFGPPGSLLPPNGNDEDYEQYLDRVGDSSSTLLNSDLAFYMPPNPASGHDASVLTPGGDGKKHKLKNNGASSTKNGKHRNRGKNFRNDPLSNQNIPQPCTRETQGLLYFDLDSSKMYRCMDRQWQHWGWGLTGATAGPSPPAIKQPNSVRRAASTREPSNIQTSRDCPPGWLLDGDTCYLVVTERMPWKNAALKCRSHNSFLTHVESKKHLNWLWKLTGGQHFWTGLHMESIDPSRQWRNADQTMPRYFNWRAGSPCNGARDCSASRGELCVAVRSRRQMVDGPCESSRLGSICTKPAGFQAGSPSRRRRISGRRSPVNS